MKFSLIEYLDCLSVLLMVTDIFTFTCLIVPTAMQLEKLSLFLARATVKQIEYSDCLGVLLMVTDTP